MPVRAARHCYRRPWLLAGRALARFVDAFGEQCSYIGIDVSEPMLDAARERFAPYSCVDIRSCDLRSDYPMTDASVTLSVLTLQFVPIEYRLQLVRRMYEHTVPGGVVILVEKLLGATATIDTLMAQEYLAMKAANGYSQEQIERKRLSLEGVLVPVTSDWNRDLLRQAGFTQVDCFWRYLNFAGFIALR
ncbi:MAG: methyltransferase domain-containing protein [Deltaproteobacteria bacterium]|nr:methyltransferase domain-containing protein [Deltaproteobacteria bacterium]